VGRGPGPGDDFPTRAHACAERALGWLLEMVDARSGGAPNYGLNDGARVLPLAATDYTDFRPVAQAAHYALRGSRCYEPGPWDEKLLWLFGPQALQAPLRRHERSSHWRADAGGYYAMRGPRTWGLTRCHTYRGRPGQADMLHLDLWLDQTNVLRDGGSYHYYTDPPWQDYFNSTAAHNTIEVDRRDQMIRGPRFTWFRWTRSRLIRFEQAAGGRLTCFEGEHEGYARLPGRVIHRRTICRIDDTYLVIDDLLGAGRHEIALRWRLCPAAWRACDEGYQSRVGDLDVTIALHHPDGLARELLTGQEAPEPEGWESLYYGEKLAVPILRVRGEAALPARLVSLISSEAGLRVADAGSHVTPLRLAGVARELARDLERVSAGRVLAG